MMRTVVLLLIAYFCVNVTSYDDYTLKALQSLEEPEIYQSTVQVIPGKSNHNDEVQEPETSSPEPRTPPSTFTNEHFSPKTKQNFEKIYLDLKEYYEEKLRNLKAENDLLKKLNLASSNSNAMHTIQTFCTCNVTDRPITNDCNNSQTNILLEKVEEIHKQCSNSQTNILLEKEEEIHKQCSNSQTNILLENVLEQLSNLAENNQVAKTTVEYNWDAELEDGERPINWKQLPGEAVEISAKGRELWVINSANNIYRWDGSKFEQKPGAAVRVGASPDGWTWIVNGNDNIYRWNVDKKNWDLMPGLLVQISAISKDRALGVNRGHGIFLWSNNAWTQLPGAATWAGIGDGDERWVVNSGQAIWRWIHQSSNWILMPGKAKNVDVQNPSRVIVTNASNQMFLWKNNNWQMLNGAGTRSSINGSHYYTVNSAQQIFIGN